MALSSIPTDSDQYLFQKYDISSRVLIPTIPAGMKKNPYSITKRPGSVPGTFGIMRNLERRTSRIKI